MQSLQPGIQTTEQKIWSLGSSMYEQKLRVRSDTLVVQLGIEPWLGIQQPE
jgi:hypothetical protein